MDRATLLYKSDPVRGAVWDGVFPEEAPDIAIDVWSPDAPSDAAYLVAWIPPEDLARSVPKLEVLFSLGTGVASGPRPPRAIRRHLDGLALENVVDRRQAYRL